MGIKARAEWNYQCSISKMITLYSQYFNPAISRKYGRRIIKEKAKNYSDDKLEQILRTMNLKHECEEKDSRAYRQCRRIY